MCAPSGRIPPPSQDQGRAVAGAPLCDGGASSTTADLRAVGGAVGARPVVVMNRTRTRGCPCGTDPGDRAPRRGDRRPRGGARLRDGGERFGRNTAIGAIGGGFGDDGAPTSPLEERGSGLGARSRRRPPARRCRANFVADGGEMNGVAERGVSSVIQPHGDEGCAGARGRTCAARGRDAHLVAALSELDGHDGAGHRVDSKGGGTDASFDWERRCRRSQRNCTRRSSRRCEPRQSRSSRGGSRAPRVVPRLERRSRATAPRTTSRSCRWRGAKHAAAA